MCGFLIATDSTADLPEEYLEEHKIGLLNIPYILEGITYDGTKSLEYQQFYAKMRQGALPTTSQINPLDARRGLEPYLEKGLDVLYIAFSSGLSGSFNNIRMAAMELQEEYPERKIEVVDSLCASLGEGLLVHKAVQLKEEGKSLEEVVSWIEQYKLNICHLIMVDDLNHLHRGGRVSKTEAVLGSLINIKPIIHVDDNGKLIPIGKARGRKSSLRMLVDNMQKHVGTFDNDIVFICHADVEEDAKYVRDLIIERLGIQNFMIHSMGPTIGAHTGPGTIALFFMGEQR